MNISPREYVSLLIPPTLTGTMKEVHSVYIANVVTRYYRAVLWMLLIDCRHRNV